MFCNKKRPKNVYERGKKVTWLAEGMIKFKAKKRVTKDHLRKQAVTRTVGEMFLGVTKSHLRKHSSDEVPNEKV